MEENGMRRPWYKKAFRRILVDMHIPDWDDQFLAKYDPYQMLQCYLKANVTSVMFYCQSHIGFCYFPTKVGKIHNAFKERDIVTELLCLLKDNGIAATAYYSVNYNDWAFWEHPEWRTQPCGDRSAVSFSRSRYGTCCLNNPGYRSFVMTQIDEILTNRNFDHIFFDDTFWPTICLCPHCRLRYSREIGKEIPLEINWSSADWCEFQSARERWLIDYVKELEVTAKKVQPNITVNHNFGLALGSWVFGVPFGSAQYHEFLGGDLYGDPLEQLLVTKLEINLSKNLPVEFYTSHTTGVREHIQEKSFEQMELQALASTLLGSAFMFIDWINPDGTVNSGIFEKIGKVYGITSIYEPFLGGNSIEDVAVYYSYDSKVDFQDNGRPLNDIDPWADEFNPPHVKALRGVCQALQSSHIPFGIITKKQLPSLDKYKIIILPNLLRVCSEEVRAFRDYVSSGGNLYASCYTSLVESSGTFHNDFMLADVFGCHYETDVMGSMSYLKPTDPGIINIIAPQQYLSLSPELVMFGPSKDRPLVKPIKLTTKVEGKVLGKLTVPYNELESGTIFDHNWSSIHSSPPWQDTDHPVIVTHRYGLGRSIYSSAAIESLASDTPNRLFLFLIKTLSTKPLSYSSDAHPAVWINVVFQPDQNRFVASFLNYPNQLPCIPVPKFNFTMQRVPGKQFRYVEELPSSNPVFYQIDNDGSIHFNIEGLEKFKMFAIDLQTNNDHSNTTQ